MKGVGLSIPRTTIGRRLGHLGHLGRQLAAALLPQDCFVCGSQSGDSILCRSCEGELPRISDPCCPVCALPTAAGGERSLANIPGTVCGACLKEPPHFDATHALFAYAFPVEHLVQGLKYRSQLPIADYFAGAFADSLPARGGSRIDCMVPLPLHPLRLRERGFNQATEIARPLAQRLKLPLLATACTRELDTAPQTSLPWKARQANIRNAFECSIDLTGKTIAVVDDVMTTGATLNEFARALKKHGAAHVSSWVMARTLPK